MKIPAPGPAVPGDDWVDLQAEGGEQRVSLDRPRAPGRARFARAAPAAGKRRRTPQTVLIEEFW